MRGATLQRWLMLLGTLVTCPGSAVAQEQPQRTTATYEDWTLRCDLKPGPPPQKTCQISQSARLQSQANPVTQIAIGRVAKGQALKMVVQVPINVWLPAGVKAVFDDKEPGLDMTFKRCTPSGCLADLDIGDDVITKLRNATANGKLQFKDGTQKDVAVPISFKGFGQAFDALSKE